MSDKRPSIDFSRFSSLRKAVWQPIRNDSGLESLNSLEELDVWRFKPKDKSYSSMQLPNNIKKLDLNWCNPSSLDEIPTLKDLEKLQIHYCRNLESVATSFNFAPNLKRLVITRCVNLSDYEVVNEIDWEHLYINIKGKAVANNQRQAMLKAARLL